jgi:hypothetical protein
MSINDCTELRHGVFQRQQEGDSEESKLPYCALHYSSSNSDVVVGAADEATANIIARTIARSNDNQYVDDHFVANRHDDGQWRRSRPSS